jgi:ABC-type branched-subunit amino acid transport system substrate-binding protein
MPMTTVARLAAAAALGLASCSAAVADEQIGVTKTEVVIGQSVPYSGPASAYGIIGKTQLAYYRMINDKGGIHGRKITLLSHDDGYSPPKALETTRRLVESDNVLAIVGTLGTPPNVAIQQYLNAKKIPQLIFAGASRFADPGRFPWTVTFYPSYRLEGQILGRYAMAAKPGSKVGILYQNDDAGKEFVAGFKQGMGDKVDRVVSEFSYETSAPTIDSQILQLKASGAEVFFNMSTPKFAAQAIRRAAEVGWKPLHIMTSVSTSIDAVLKPAGLENAKDIVSAAFLKTASGEWANDAEVKEFGDFVQKYMPGDNASDFNIAFGYMEAAIFARIIEGAGADLNRETLLKAATNLKAFRPPLLLPGLVVSTSPTNYESFNSVRLQRFDGSSWVMLDEVISR